jgi:hypothetical protein
MDATTIVIILTIGTTFLGVAMRYSFRSKCDQVSILWGCLNIHREVAREIQSVPSDNQINVVGTI